MKSGACTLPGDCILSLPDTADELRVGGFELFEHLLVVRNRIKHAVYPLSSPSDGTCMLNVRPRSRSMPTTHEHILLPSEQTNRYCSVRPHHIMAMLFLVSP